MPERDSSLLSTTQMDEPEKEVFDNIVFRLFPSNFYSMMIFLSLWHTAAFYGLYLIFNGEICWQTIVFGKEKD